MSDTQDFDALRDNLKNLKVSLENERIKAQQRLFIDFTQNIMGMSPEDERSVLLSESYMATVKQLANENVLLHDRLHNFINSDFLYKQRGRNSRLQKFGTFFQPFHNGGFRHHRA